MNRFLSLPQVLESARQCISTSIGVSPFYSEACAIACHISRTCDPETETWYHSTWSHAVSHATWLLRVLKIFAHGEVRDGLTPEQKSSDVMEAAAVWAADHFEYALALVEAEVKLTAEESSTCDMVRWIIKRCPSDPIAAAAADVCISHLFDIFAPKLKDPPNSSIPYATRPSPNEIL